MKSVVRSNSYIEISDSEENALWDLLIQDREVVLLN